MTSPWVVNYLEPFAGSIAMLLGCPAWDGEPVRAPFPYFGGKSRAVEIVWSRFGGARLPQVWTVNDVNAFIANVWRSIAWDPEAVARWASWPVNETDLHSRHRWLLKMAALLRARLDADPMLYDARIAGWWIWGASAWIGSGWCEEQAGAIRRLPSLGAAVPSSESRDGAGSHGGRGVHSGGMRAPTRQLPDLIGAAHNPGKASGVHNKGMRQPGRRLPDLAGGTQWGTDEANVRAGACTARARGSRRGRLPCLGGSGSDGDPFANVGRGLNAQGMRAPGRQLPDLGGGHDTFGRGVAAPSNRTRLHDIFAELSRRLRHVRVACGDWARICTDAVTHRHGTTAVFLDPPYDGYEGVYGQADEAGEALSTRVRRWALEMGKRPDMRVCLAGYEGEHDELEAAGWEVVAWKAKGGFANQGAKAGENAKRERLWFSPHCLKLDMGAGIGPLFARLG